MSTEGVIYRVAGPVVTAVGISPRMYDVVHVGNERLMGEVIKIVGDKSIIQVYEDTTGVKPGEPAPQTDNGGGEQTGGEEPAPAPAYSAPAAQNPSPSVKPAVSEEIPVEPVVDGGESGDDDPFDSIFKIFNSK